MYRERYIIYRKGRSLQEKAFDHVPLFDTKVECGHLTWAHKGRHTCMPMSPQETTSMSCPCHVHVLSMCPSKSACRDDLHWTKSDWSLHGGFPWKSTNLSRSDIHFHGGRAGGLRGMLGWPVSGRNPEPRHLMTFASQLLMGAKNSSMRTLESKSSKELDLAQRTAGCSQKQAAVMLQHSKKRHHSENNTHKHEENWPQMF